MKREYTAFTEISLKLTKLQEKKANGPIWAKMYWSQNKGIYGHQVILEYNAGKGAGLETYTTSGCGYCKESSALEHFHQAVFGKYIGMDGSMDYYSRGTKYHKGGNYYKLTLKQLKDIKGAR